MHFEENLFLKNFGEKLGFIFAYFVFTTILFLLLFLVRKVHTFWDYIFVMVIIFLVAVVGIIFKRLLK